MKQLWLWTFLLWFALHAHGKNAPRKIDPELVKIFKALDTNSDGMITKEEGPKFGWPEGLFEMKDLNGDTKISLEEFATWRGHPRTKKLADELSDKTFVALDWNKDRKLDKGEWVGTPESFKEKDLNRDGYITRIELRKWRRARKR